MRTEEYRDFDTQLSTINRNFSHGMFLSEQFLIDNTQLIGSNPDALTKEVYFKNRYRNNFNFRLKHIGTEIKNYQKSSFIGYYIFMQSAFELYIDGLYVLINRILQGNLPKPKDIPNRSKQESKLEAISKGLGIKLTDILDQEELDTYDYIRLKRNCLVHADGKPSVQLASIITKGQQINKYWQDKKTKDKRTKLTIIDFASSQINQFDEREIIETIVVLRDIAKKIDKNVLTSLKKEDIIDHILQDYRQEFAHYIVNMPRREIENQFAYVAKIRFCIDKKDIKFAALVF